MITIETTIKQPVEQVWSAWNDPGQVKNWAFASDDWGAEGLRNDLRVGGQVVSRMFARDGSAEFMFGGTYNEVIDQQKIMYTMSDGRRVEVRFEELSHGATKVIEKFDPETENSEDMQRAGWQAILDSFARYMEST